MNVRAPNAIDFWRGAALVMIFINHVPGTVFSHLTLHNYALSDGAEMFVFLAGCSLVYITGPANARRAPGLVVSRLLKRAFELWASQLAMLWTAIALIGGFALVFQAPELFYWHGAGPAFYDTNRALLGSLALTYQIGYFNILPLYVALLTMAAIPLMIARWSRWAALGASLALYIIALTFEFNLINWPNRGSWHFNPLAWQLNLVVGYLTADYLRQEPSFDGVIRRAWPYAAAFVAFGFVVTLFKLWPSHTLFPQPRMFFLLDKGWLSPMRLISMLALAVAFYGTFDRLRPHIPAAVEFLTALGRNSLPVFCALSLAALACQMIRYLYGASFVLDATLIIAGVVMMRAIAWLSEAAPPLRGTAAMAVQRLTHPSRPY